MFSGQQREMPNDYNLEHWRANLNRGHQGKMYGFVNREWNEIWWPYPHGDSTECNQALILNLKDQCWYDTALPDSGRSAAFAPSTYRYPIMTGVDVESNNYKLWQHERGLNAVDGGASQAIRSYYVLPTMSGLKSQQPSPLGIQVKGIEADFDQVGDLRVTLEKQANARAGEVEAGPYTIAEDGSDDADQVLHIQEAGRQIRIRIESNSVDGDHKLGATYLHVEPGDESITS
jgi:hypothetical protein